MELGRKEEEKTISSEVQLVNSSPKWTGRPEESMKSHCPPDFASSRTNHSVVALISTVKLENKDVVPKKHYENFSTHFFSSHFCISSLSFGQIINSHEKFAFCHFRERFYHKSNKKKKSFEKGPNFGTFQVHIYGQ